MILDRFIFNLLQNQVFTNFLSSGLRRGVPLVYIDKSIRAFMRAIGLTIELIGLRIGHLISLTLTFVSRVVDLVFILGHFVIKLVPKLIKALHLNKILYAIGLTVNQICLNISSLFSLFCLLTGLIVVRYHLILVGFLIGKIAFRFYYYDLFSTRTNILRVLKFLKSRFTRTNILRVLKFLKSLVITPKLSLEEEAIAREITAHVIARVIEKEEVRWELEARPRRRDLENVTEFAIETIGLSQQAKRLLDEFIKDRREASRLLREEIVRAREETSREADEIDTAINNIVREARMTQLIARSGIANTSRDIELEAEVNLRIQKTLRIELELRERSRITAAAARVTQAMEDAKEEALRMESVAILENTRSAALRGELRPATEEEITRVAARVAEKVEIARKAALKQERITTMQTIREVADRIAAQRGPTNLNQRVAAQIARWAATQTADQIILQTESHL